MTASNPAVTLKMITLDCPDPRVSGAFWAELLGWEVAALEDEYAMLTGPAGIALGLGKVADHQPPGWPNDRGSKQFHFDLACTDIDATRTRVVELGGTVPDDQPGDTWTVVLDPAGHPFCLTRADSW